MTFKEIQDDALERLDFDPSVTSSSTGTPRARIKRFINEWQRRILSMPGFGRLRDGETTLATVAGTNEYTVAAVARFRNIVDQTNGWVLKEVTLDFLRRVDPRESMTGNPTHFAKRTATKIVLWPTPTAVANLTIDYVAAVTDLSADADLSVLPVDFHYLLSMGARVNEYERIDDSRARPMRGELEGGIRDLRFFMSQSVDTDVPGRTNRGPISSRLGGYFPAGT